MGAKVSKLTPANMAALKEIGAEGQGVQFGETYAIFPQNPEDALGWVQTEMADLPNRTAHPYASLHAVVRKLQSQVTSAVATTAYATPTNGRGDEFRPDPGDQFQILRGYGRDDDVFRVIEYAPITAPPEKVQALYALASMPSEAVHAWRLERDPYDKKKWVGVAFNAFPTEIMVPVGSTRAVGVLADGSAIPRSRPAHKSGSGHCEHCGLPTKGGRFVPGHDAKLKGDLQREAQSDDPKIRIPALVESAIRAADNTKWAIPPSNDEDANAVQDALLVGEPEFLAARIAAREAAVLEVEA